MASTFATFDAALKERNTTDKVEEMMFADRPLFGTIAKDTTLEGESFIVPLINTAPQGVSGTLGASYMDTVLAGTGANVGVQRFTVTCGTYNAWVEIGDKVMKASRGNAGAFLENKTIEIDALYEQASDSLATYLYGNGGLAIGQRASASTNVITLTSGDSVSAFSPGMYIQASAGDGSSTGDAARTGSTYVTAVDPEGNTITVNSAAAISSFSDGDYLFRLGDFVGNTGIDVLKGLGAYIYASSSAVPALYGMTRTSNPQMLAGSRLAAADYAGLSTEDRLQALCTRMVGRYRGKGATHIYMNPSDWQELAYGLQARGVRPAQDTSTKFGYMMIEMVCGGRMVKVVPDRFAPQGTAWALHMPTLKLRSMLGLLHVVNGDGLTMLRKSGTNDFQYRLVSYPALTCNAPGWSGRVPV